MDACCAETVVRDDGEVGSPNSFTTCICGSTWTWNEAGEPVFHQQERKCLVCKHWSCPCCGDYCDSTVDGEDGEVDMCPCDGQCTYAEAPPEVVRI